MKERITTYILTLTLLAFGNTLFGQFSPKEQNDIQKKARKLLTEYENKMNQLGKDVKSIDKTYVNMEDFIKLFINRKTQIYNDLDPAHLLSEYYEAETYASNLALWYKSGITVKLNFDQMQLSNIIAHGEGVYSIDMVVERQIAGFYFNKTQNSNTEKLLFRVGFTSDNGSLQNFKIAGIRKATENFKEDGNKILELKSTKLTEDEKRNIDRATRTLLNDYANYLSLIGDTVEDIEEKIMFKESFRSLFASPQSTVYNDVLPGAKKNLVLSVSDYINLYSQAYVSDGGTVVFNLDSADLGFIKKEKENQFSRSVHIIKSFTGYYRGKTKVAYRNRLVLKVVFEYSNNIFKNFKIDKIDLEKISKPEAQVPVTFTTIQNSKIAKPDKSVRSVKTNKFQISFGYTNGTGLIDDKNLYGFFINENSHSWKTNAKYFGNLTLKVAYLLNPRIGIEAGIGFLPVGTIYSINSTTEPDSVFRDKTEYHDQNGEVYYKNIKAKYDSTVSTKILNIPISIIFSFPVTRRISFDFKPGIDIGFITNATSKSNGYLAYYGTYNNELIEKIGVGSWPEFGAYTHFANNKEQDIKQFLNKTEYSLNASLGLNYNVNERFSIGLSGFFQCGLSDLIKNKTNYIDVFGQTELNNNLNGSGQTQGNQDLAKWNHVFGYKLTRIILYGTNIEFIVKL